jgi:preprotein translocase subunit SecG
MYIVFGVVIVLIAILLALVVIIQNPKGGVLSSSIGSMSNQILGASRSTDAVEKITWYLAGGLMVLCVASILVLPKSSDTNKNTTTQSSAIEEALKNNKAPIPAPAVPMNTPPQSSTTGSNSSNNGQMQVNTNSEPASQETKK